MEDAIGLDELKIILRPTIHEAQLFLALINACYGGSFLTVRTSFGTGALEESGAQAITAGGADDLVHAYEDVGKGSVFFEMVAAALSGQGISVGGERFDDPSEGRGILTATDLADYLIDTIRIIENQNQSPRFGSLTGNQPGRQGEFFFIVDEEQARKTFARIYPQRMRRMFGAEEEVDGNSLAHETVDPRVGAAAAEVTPAEDLAALVGHWTCSYSRPPPPWGPDNVIELEVTADCAVGRTCGWISVPSVPCRGRLTLIDIREEGFEFNVDRFDESSDMSTCTPGAGEVLKPLADGTLSYTATYSGATGVLSRQ